MASSEARHQGNRNSELIQEGGPMGFIASGPFKFVA